MNELQEQVDKSPEQPKFITVCFNFIEFKERGNVQYQFRRHIFSCSEWTKIRDKKSIGQVLEIMEFAKVPHRNNTYDYNFDKEFDFIAEPGKFTLMSFIYNPELLKLKTQSMLTLHENQTFEVLLDVPDVTSSQERLEFIFTNGKGDFLAQNLESIWQIFQELLTKPAAETSHLF